MSMQTHPSLPIRTQRLILRDLVVSDFDDVHRYGSDPEVALYMDWGPNTSEDTRGALERAAKEQTASPRSNFSLGMELEGRIVGSISLRLRENRTADFGYCLRRDCWRKGITFEASTAILDVGFRDLGLHRIFATCDTRNQGSLSVMRKLGMREEGCFRLDKLVKGKWRDTFLYAILADEWSESRGLALKISL